MTSMTSFKNKYKLVKITWWDIKSSEKSWLNIDDVESEDIAICYDVGYLYKKTSEKLWLFTSYSTDNSGTDVGGITCFPVACIKNIEVIK
jgi:hypothetical protein